MKVTSVPFGQVDSQPVNLFTLENDQGVTVKITNYGGIVTSIVGIGPGDSSSPDSGTRSSRLISRSPSAPINEEPPPDPSTALRQSVSVLPE